MSCRREPNSSSAYGNRPSPTARQIEQRVIGGDWGANGFTTRAQADALADGLGLSVGDRLLGLYLAARTGCRVVLTCQERA
jgi:hypothetical protein